jgi:hypothetical protein
MLPVRVYGEHTVVSSSRGETKPRLKRGAVSQIERMVDHDGPLSFTDRPGTVFRAVVHHEDVCRGNGFFYLSDHHADALLFIECRQHRKMSHVKTLCLKNVNVYMSESFFPALHYT